MRALFTGPKRIFLFWGLGGLLAVSAIGAGVWAMNRPEPPPPSGSRPQKPVNVMPGGPNTSEEQQRLRVLVAERNTQAAIARDESNVVHMGTQEIASVRQQSAPPASSNVFTPAATSSPPPPPRRMPDKDTAGGIPDLSSLINEWDGDPRHVQRVDLAKFQPKPSERPTRELNGEGNGQTRKVKEVIAGANLRAYGEVEIGGSSDNTSVPITVKILGGPLNGAIAQAHMSGLRGNNGSIYQTVSIDTITLRDGRQAKTKAHLFSTKTMFPEVASDYDPHTMERVVLPALAGFAQGVGQAALFAGTAAFAGPFGGGFSTGGFNWERAVATGVGGAAAATGNVLRESIPRRGTSYIRSASEVGIVFLEPVVVEN